MNPIRTFRSIAGMPSTVRLLVLGIVINNIGNMIGPFLSLIMVQKLGLSPASAGAAMGAYAVGSFASILAGGWCTDHLGRRRTLLLSTTVGGSLALTLGSASRAEVFFPLLFAFGFVTELFRPAVMALQADLAPSGSRASVFAASRVAQNLGFSLSMVLGGLFLDWNWRALFWWDGATTLAFAWLAFRFIPETRTAAPRRQASSPRFRLGSVFPWEDRVFHLNLAASLILATLYMSHTSILPLTMTQAAGYSSRAAGSILAINGILVTLLEIGVVQELRRFRRLRVVALGAALIGLGLGLSGLWMHWGWFVLTLLVWSAGEIIAFSLLMSFHTDWAPPERRGQYMSLVQSTWKIAQVLNSLLLLPLYGAVPAQTFWLLMPLAAIPTVAVLLHLDRRYDHPGLLRGLASRA